MQQARKRRYVVQLQAFDSALAWLGETDDFAFARQLMLAAFAKFCTPGAAYPFERPNGTFVTRAINEPVVALYDNGEWVDAIGWSEENTIGT